MNRSDSPPGLPTVRQLQMQERIPKPPPSTNPPTSPSRHTHKRVLRKKQSQKHFSLPSDSLIRLKLTSRTESMSSGLSVDSDIPSHLPKFQSYFIQGFVRPIFERLNECSDFDGKVLMDNMNDNVNRWKEQLKKKKSDDAKTKNYSSSSSDGVKTKEEER